MLHHNQNYEQIQEEISMNNFPHACELLTLDVEPNMRARS